MLSKLVIQNYAIIDFIEINFSEHFNIITGETGAGKSILVGALSLILGERADSSSLLSKEKKCFVEGIFNIEKRRNVVKFLNDNDYGEDDELVLRREIAANGKSRGFINDTPANIQQLKQLASMLVDLHQQFDTLELGDSDFQREVLDALAGNERLLAEYIGMYSEWKQTQQQLEALTASKNNFQKELDYNRFLFDELHEANFSENELEDLDNELQLLSNAEEIKMALETSVYELKESEQPIVQTLKQLVNKLSVFASFNANLEEIIKRLQSTQIELADIGNELENLNNDVNYDEQRINFINERLAVGYKLQKKHGVQSTKELLEIKETLQQKLDDVLNIDEAIRSTQNTFDRQLKQLETLAETLSSKRKKVVDAFEKNVNSLLAQVGMPNAVIKVVVSDIALHAFGKNAIEFLFDANKSNRFEPLRKVASGGELSRLMLCIKSLVAEKINLPTLIFDEIDTGISGEAAKQVGVILKQLAKQRQVISITHQPQIAGKADVHFYVYKQVKNDMVNTNIRQLNTDERIQAIAQMLSGEKPTAAAIENAREMIAN
ncbi:DNA repair protein RecN [Parafilimonas terrae]|uniref:DNA repair protein RecN n=1 Tax=Parafilimonas terrae TaxID=1465490 RepID=A0A1I5SKI6_9BACT|nr:DNA repair protein RecN [Parafilimonas terrae]SFP71202.1 DNA replication and repair protein RecN [Parafilimonas terrae]